MSTRNIARRNVVKNLRADLTTVKLLTFFDFIVINIVI